MLKVLLLSLSFALASAPAHAGRASDHAKQLSHNVNEAGDETTLRFSWRGGGGGEDGIRARVSTDEIAADKGVKRVVQLEDLHEAMARAARKSAQGRKGVRLEAAASKQGVELRVSGPRSETKPAMEAAKAAMERRREAWMANHQVFEIEPGVLSYDHALVVAARADAVAPVAAALREGTPSDRAFVERALRFTQSIPYQSSRRGGDTGFQRPLALLARNKGDCDGKSALFLALVRAELPGVPLAMVYVPGHALVGVGLPAGEGDQTFEAKGQTFVFAEPVGPAAYPLGRAAPQNKKAGKKGIVRVVPRSAGS